MHLHLPAPPPSPEPGGVTDTDLFERARDLVDARRDGYRHSVAAAVLAADGVVALGLNLSHFTGGPCAELVALANLAALTSAPALRIVSVGDGGRGILPPCGRCRQVLLDVHPGARVVLDLDGLSLSVEEALPTAYLRHLHAR